MTPGQLKTLIVGGALLAALALAAFFGHRAGANGVQADWDRDKLAQAQAQQQAVLAAVAANEAAHKADIESTQATLAVYKESLYAANERIVADRDRAERDRLRITIPTRVCPAPAGEAPDPGRADAVATVETIELPAAIEQGLRDIAEDADREVAGLAAQLAALQDWIRTHGFYEVGTPP